MSYFDSLAKKYDSGKHGCFFGDAYDKHLLDNANKVKKILEIGLTHGKSINMWHEYFSQAKIYGMDYAMEKREEFHESLKRLSTKDFCDIHSGDQSKRSDLKQVIDKFKGDFDIIIDDGGHMMHEQCISLGYLFSHVKSGGYYVIEDLHTSLVPFPNRWNIGINSSREYKYKNDGNNFPTDGEETFTALEVLENYKKNKKIVTPYLRENEILYLNNNIDDIQIYYTGNCEREWGNKYVIAFIKKK